MLPPQSPVPLVDDALSPYIRTRENTTRIRQILTIALARCVEGDQDPSHLLLSVPSPDLRARHDTLPSDGLHKQYLQALIAHRKAQEHYDAVKAELNAAIQRNSTETSKTPSLSSGNAAREYAKLLRERRQRDRLEIIQTSLTRLLDEEPNPSHLDVKSSVREEIGELPQPPVAGVAVKGAPDSKIEALTFRLKKDLLVAKQKYDEANARRLEAEHDATSKGEILLDEKVERLRSARADLISWVEGELAKISEDESAASPVEASFLEEDEDAGLTAISRMSEVELSTQSEELYSRYVAARQQYISKVEDALEQIEETVQPRDAEYGASIQSPRRRQKFERWTKATELQASQILPNLNILTAVHKEEALLQQQTSHLRRQLAIGSEDTEAVIQRLAGESLLIPQGSTAVTAWAKAAEEAGAKSKEVVGEQIMAGDSSISSAKLVFEGLRARRQAVADLKKGL